MNKFILDANGVNFDNNGEKIKIADPMIIESIQQNIDDGTYKVKV